MTVSVLFDASRLISREQRTAPTGVDRICLAYAEWLLSRTDLSVTAVKAKRGGLVAVDATWFRAFVSSLRSRWTGDYFERALTPDEASLMDALNRPGRASKSVLGTPPASKPARRARAAPSWPRYFKAHWADVLPPASLYFNVGHTGLADETILRTLAARGVEPIIMLADLIPITHPEFCRSGDGEKHRSRVLTALRHAAHIFTISDYTSAELLAFAQAEGVRSPPVHTVLLGLEPAFFQARTQPPTTPYFVHVGTIEARKNLAFLLTVWRRLAEAMGDETPKLVLIGRYGWENEAVLDHLQRSPPLQGIVHQASDLPDAVLASLMLGATAVLAPSSVEGFDLPAVEACAMGVPLIASDIPAHRELVPQAVLVDPLDGPGWLSAVETALTVRPEMPAYAAPSWDAHFAEVCRNLGLEPALRG